jgi:hypothetical protein
VIDRMAKGHPINRLTELQTIGQILDRFSPQEWRNFFNQAGYAT